MTPTYASFLSYTDKQDYLTIIVPIRIAIYHLTHIHLGSLCSHHRTSTAIVDLLLLLMGYSRLSFKATNVPQADAIGAIQ